MESDQPMEAPAAKESAAEKEATAAKRAYILALAGAVVAIVGVVVGAGSSWLISREDRSNQRALAREGRAYDRRASAYLDALSLFQPLQLQLGQSAQERVEVGGRTVLRPRHPVFPNRRAIQLGLARLDSAERLHLTLIAFASPRAITAYENARDAARAAFRDADQVWDLFPPGIDEPGSSIDLAELLQPAGSRADLRRLRRLQSQYERDTRNFFDAFGSLLDASHQDIG
jgi:hypothetical protein